MNKKRVSPERIVDKLQEPEAAWSSGQAVTAAYRWRKGYEASGGSGEAVEGARE